MKVEEPGESCAPPGRKAAWQAEVLPDYQITGTPVSPHTLFYHLQHPKSEVPHSVSLESAWTLPGSPAVHTVGSLLD